MSFKYNKKDIKTWIKALRSGDYKQTIGKLQNEFGFCCLGVACDLFIPKVDQERINENRFLVGCLPFQQKHSPKWLNDINTEVHRRSGVTLSDLNDYRNASFKDIANILEQYFLKGGVK